VQQGRWWRITGRVLGELVPKVEYVDEEGIPF